MTKTGACVCCDRPDVTLPAKGLCWACYSAARSGEIYEHELHGWVAKAQHVANRLGCVWESDPALEIVPMGDGDFAEAALPDDERAAPQVNVEMESVDTDGDVVDTNDAESKYPSDIEIDQARHGIPLQTDVELLDGFEAYEKFAGSMDTPAVSVQKTGKVRFNRAAVQTFGLLGMTHVELLWNPDQLQVAMRLLLTDHGGAALKLTVMDGRKSMCFHGSGFFRAKGVRPKVGRPFPLRELRPGLLVADIDIERTA